MGKLIAQVVLHANGAFGAGGGERPTGEDMDDHVVSILETCDGIVLGRTSYGILGSYWPGDGVAENSRVARPLNALPKYVVSTTLDVPSWKPVTVLSNEPFARLREIKEELSGNLITYGSSKLVAGLADNGLVDEFHVIIGPVMAGALPPFCSTLAHTIELQLDEVKRFIGDRILLRYSLV